MNYIYLLSNNELIEICQLMTGKAFRELYKKNSKEFSTMKRGFRPNSMSNEDAINTAVLYKEKRFISDAINKQIEKWLIDADKELSLQETTAENPDLAMAKMLKSTPFSENIKLYFLLKESDVDEQYISKIESLMMRDTVQDTAVDKGEKNAESTQDENTVKIDELSKKLKEEAERHSEEMNMLRKEKEQLSQQIQSATDEVKTLQRINQEKEEELIDLRARIEYDDYEEIEEILERSVDYISLCEVTEPDYNGQIWLTRLADISKNGVVEKFYLNEDLPWYFSNRPRIYYKDGPSEVGMVGVWDWTSIPNKTDSTKDYVASSYNPDISPIEIISLSECKNSKALIEKLKNGFKADITTKRVMISVYLQKGNYTGFLCTDKDIELVGELWRLSSSTISLPKYEFNRRDTTLLENSKVYFRKISIGVPNEIVNVKLPAEIVKQIVMERNSWQTFKQMGRTRNDWRNLRDFFNNLENESILEAIAKELRYTPEKAKQELEHFIKNANSYIDGTTFEDEVLLSILSVNDSLMSRCKDLLEAEWKDENQEMLLAADNEFQMLHKKIEEAEEEYQKKLTEGEKNVKNQIEKAKLELGEIEQKHNLYQAHLEEIEKTISEKEKFAQDVEDIIAERIKKAQENAAEFIANMAFVNAPQVSTVQPEILVQPVAPNIIVETAVASDERKSYFPGVGLMKENIEVINDWNMLLDIISEGLVDAGVRINYARPLAAYLFSAYINHCPLLVVGPNSADIVDVMAKTLTAKSAGVLNLSDLYDSNVVEDFILGEDDIVRIDNPFASAWIAKLPGLVNESTKYCYTVYPYMEDVQIEPKSMFNYMLPLFTELFVEKAPVTCMLGVRKAKSYKDYKIVNSEKIHEKFMTSLRMPLLVKSRMQAVLTNMHKMLGDKSMDYDVIFGLLPYAFSTMQMSKMTDAIQNTDNSKIQISAEALRLLENYIGEEE